jgi:cytochrome c oxidase subunit 2
MEGIIDFHHDLMFILIFIIVLILWFLIKITNSIRNKELFNIVKSKNYFNKFIKKIKPHHSFLEVVWTIIPALILLFILIPSLALLYSMDELIDPNITIKVIGNQWYWKYEYSDYNNQLINKDNNKIEFSSYLIDEDNLVYGSFRLLETDNRVIIPWKTHIRFLITSADVIHSWAIPSLGIKVDACPGRLNQIITYAKRLGTLYGQCSEICGVNHGFMPITIDVVTYKVYIDFLKNFE